MMMKLPPELRQNYIERRKKDIESLRQAVGSKDFSVAQRIGHQLKGNGITYGFELLSQLGAEMEDLAKNQDLLGLDRVVHQLEEWMNTVT